MTSAIADAYGRLSGHEIHAALVWRHSEPWRAYHVWAHPRAMILHMEAAEAAGVPIVDADACVAFAAWHDSVYDPQAPHGRNEELSARLCEAEAPIVFRRKSVKRACAATRATIGHMPVPPVECPDIALCLDIDLSILGADEEMFDAYDLKHIPYEYAHAPLDAFRARRAGVLATFLERPTLYLTEWGRGIWEDRARANLSRAIARLSS